MWKKLILILTLGLLTCAGFAGNEAVTGEWDCRAYVDMDYPFVMNLEEAESGLTGSAKSAQGTLTLESIVLDGAALTFKLTHPDAGDIDFKTTVSDDSIEGTLGNYSFQGTLKCGRPAAE